MRISDWSSDVCSSDLMDQDLVVDRARGHRGLRLLHAGDHACERTEATHTAHLRELSAQVVHVELTLGELGRHALGIFLLDRFRRLLDEADDIAHAEDAAGDTLRSEEHTSELQSLMRISYAVFCLKKKKKNNTTNS